MPDLREIQSHFTDGRRHSLRSLMRNFQCEPPEVLQHLTRRNGFVERTHGKTTVYDLNPILSEIENLENGEINL